MPSALTIAGSDSVSGAGVQADLKTFAALGVYGVTAITAITSQDTTMVSEVFALPPDTVKSQLARIFEDVRVSAIKTGMLATPGIVRVVAHVLSTLQHRKLVVDPVMAATAGGRTLLETDAVSILKAQLLPLAEMVTPNITEAQVLSGVHVDSLVTAREAAKRITDLGPAAVVIKGGHLAGTQAVDLLYHLGSFVEFDAPRLPIGPIHGTGCTFASAIAAGLALGDDIPAAVQRAKHYITGAIEHSFAIGRGARVVDHFWHNRKPR